MKQVLKVYEERLNNRRGSLKQLLRRLWIIGYLRGAIGLLIPATLWVAFVTHILSGWFALLPAIVFLVIHKHYDDGHQRLNRARRAVDFYERGIARIEGRSIDNGGVTGAQFADATHLYAWDLDILGKGSLFESLCTARTQCGQETLARWLCRPAGRSEILRRQQAIQELRDSIDLREELAVFGPEGSAINFDVTTEWARRPTLLPVGMLRVAAPFLAAFTVGAIALSFWFRIAMWIPALAVAVQLGFALRYRERVRDVTLSIGESARELGLLNVPLQRLERERFSSAKLCELKDALMRGDCRASSRIHSFVGFATLLDYRRDPSVGLFLPILLWSTQIAFAAESWRSKYGNVLKDWMAVVSEFEALSALACYAFEHPENPFPTILEGGACLDAKELRHPLILQHEWVANSISLGRELQLLIVSGSNMSGKSTLLRTIGINMVLALAGAPVCCKEFKCSPMQIGATLRVQDSLQKGISQFYAEIRRLKTIMNLAEEGVPVLFLFDEILHGTNSHDRAIGAEAVVRALVEYKAIGLVTTHDLALARVADALEPRAMNVHFEDHLENGEMIFDYRLHEGIIQKSNALELMRSIGLKV